MSPNPSACRQHNRSQKNRSESSHVCRPFSGMCAPNARLRPRRLMISAGRRRLEADVGRQWHVVPYILRNISPPRGSVADLHDPRHECDARGANAACHLPTPGRWTDHVGGRRPSIFSGPRIPRCHPNFIPSEPSRAVQNSAPLIKSSKIHRTIRSTAHNTRSIPRSTALNLAIFRIASRTRASRIHPWCRQRDVLVIRSRS